jgi:fatty acid desaturase
MTAIQHDIAALRRRFQELGYLERPTGRMLATFALYVAVGSGAMLAFFAVANLPLRAVALALSTCAFLGAITLAHTASHQATSASRFVNGLLTYVANPVLHGLSARYWIHSHVEVHHPAPNVLGVDQDCDLRPFFVLNEEHLRQGGPLRRLLLPLQGLLLPLMLPLNGINMQKHGWVHLAGEVWRGRGRELSLWLDVACLLVHYALFLALPLAFFSPTVVITFYLARLTLCGTLLFFVLAPGHFPAAAKVIAESEQEAGDFYLRQTAATTNFRTGWLGELLTHGLQYQVEHHLFPSICHIYYDRVSPHVRELCARHGLPYQELSWPRAILDSYLAFVRPKPVCSNVESLREPIAHA